jgi:methylmalonyl-CoA mutase, N-terminal domain
VAFTFANAVAYVQAALAAGMTIDEFAPRLSFFFAAHNNLFEEVAKFRAARRLWAQIVRERFAAKDERSMLLRFHTQTGGSTLTAQQPENNVIRTTVQAMAAVLGGTQSLHTNSFDEALALPTEKSAEIALRTQQILAFASGIADSADPRGGSFYVEYLTDQVEQKARDLMAVIDSKGGAISCIENGYFQDELARSAYKYQMQIERDEAVVVGVNRFKTDRTEVPAVLRLDADLERRQIDALRKLKASRDSDRVTRSLEELRETAQSSTNIVGPVLNAVENYATVGEISDVFRTIWGEYHARY